MHFTLDRKSTAPTCAGQVTQGQRVTNSDFTNILEGSHLLRSSRASSCTASGPHVLPAECCRFSSSCALVEAGGGRRVPEAEQTSQQCLVKEL